MNDLERFLAAIRNVETQSYEGDYTRYDRTKGRDGVVGAYGFLESQWSYLAALTGIPGAPWQEPAAQDWVASNLVASFFHRYGSWEMAGVAWIGGTEAADKVVGRVNMQIANPAIKAYVESIMEAAPGVPTNLPMVAPQISLTPSGWANPVAGANEWSAGSFLYRRPPGAVKAGKTPVHEGIDIYAERGTPIVAPVSGTVVSAGTGKRAGNYVKILGDDGITYYMAHMHDYAVKKGQKVQAGWQIGRVGNTGNAQGTSPHLHFTMKNSSGQLVNPSPYLGGATALVKEPTFQQPGPHNAGSLLAGLYRSMADTVSGGAEERLDYRKVAAERAALERDPLAAGLEAAAGESEAPKYETVSVIAEPTENLPNREVEAL